MNASRWSVVLVVVAILSLSSVLFVLGAEPATPLNLNPHTNAATNLVYLPLISRALPSLNDAIQAVEPVASPNVLTTTFDAMPNPDGTMIYFTASNARGGALLSVPASGGDVISVTVGQPFTTPMGLALSTDGQTIFVADTNAVVSGTDTSAAAGNLAILGELFTVSASGGTPVPVAGSGCTAPRGLDVVNESGADIIYFTGVDPSDGKPAIMKIPASGGTLTIIDKDPRLVEPTGITVAKNGMIYVTDQKAAGNGLGGIYRIDTKHPHARLSHNEFIAMGIRMGSPAGVALTLDESLLLVSALDSNRDSSQVFAISTANLQAGLITKVIEANTGSGGLHRAHNSQLFAWAGRCKPCGKDSVYLVTPSGD